MNKQLQLVTAAGDGKASVDHVAMEIAGTPGQFITHGQLVYQYVHHLL